MPAITEMGGPGEGEPSLLGLQQRQGSDLNRKKLVMFQLDDRRLENEWSASLESWGIGCESVASRDALLSGLHQTRLIFFDVERADAFPFRVILAANISMVAIGKNVETSLKTQLLESGVDDCLETNCHIREVVARVRGILRRSRLAESKERLRSNLTWSLDPASRDLRAPGGSHVALSEVEFELMNALLASPGRIFSSRDLTEIAFLDNSRRSQARIARIVGKMRSKLIAIGAGGDLIRTIQGKGHLLSLDQPEWW